MPTGTPKKCLEPLILWICVKSNLRYDNSQTGALGFVLVNGQHSTNVDLEYIKKYIYILIKINQGSFL